MGDDKVPCSHLVFGNADEFESRYSGHTDMHGGRNTAFGPSVLLHPTRMHVLLLHVWAILTPADVQLDRHQRHCAMSRIASWPTAPRCSDDHDHPRRDLFHV